MFQIKVQEKLLADKGPCIQLLGDYVTERVHEVVSKLMCDNFITSDGYKARKECNVFFQGGSNNARGKWILLEMWTKDPKQWEEFVRILNCAVDGVIIPLKTEIHADLYHMGYGDGKGSLDLCVMIGQETGCPYDASGWGTPFRFKPEDNIQHYEVWKLCHEFGLPINNWKDEWEK